MEDHFKKRLSYFSLLREVIICDLQSQKWFKRLFPWIFLSLGVICGVIVYFIPPEIFLNHSNRIIIIYSGLLSAQGIMLAICLFAFSTILDKLSEPVVNRFLKGLNLHIYYLFLIQHIAIFQILSLTSLLVGLLVSLIINTIFWLKMSFFVGLWLFSYAARWSFGTIILIRDLIWYTTMALDPSKRVVRLDEARKQ